METYHALTPVTRPPEQPTDDSSEQHAIAPVASPTLEPETIEELAREGARRMLERALAVEVDDFLGRPRYERRLLAEHGYRNGYGRPRAVAIGTWPVEVRAPRIRDLPDDEPPFHSSILPRRRMLSAETQLLFARLYLEGLSSGDFEPAFRELLGQYATLSSSTILRLKEEWASESAAWRVRPLSARYAYIWSDGIYLGAGLEPENSCLLVVVGAREDGRKELLAMELGYRESSASWAGVLRGLRDRGMAAPLLACGDGALGLWAALDEVFPTTRHQRCWNHRVLNVLDKVPNGCGPTSDAGCVRCGAPRAGPSASSPSSRVMIVSPPFSGRQECSRRWAILNTRYSAFSRRRMRLATSVRRADPGEQRLDRVTRAQVDPVLGREVIEGHERIPVAPHRVGRGPLAMRLQPAQQRVAAQRALVDGVYVPQSAAVSAA